MGTLSLPSNGLLAHGSDERLMLSPPWARDPVALVPVRPATALRSSDAGDELSATEARWLFERRAAEDDGELRRWIVDRIDAGHLVAVRRLDADDRSSGPWRALRELIRWIEALAPGDLFRAGGRHYKLIAGGDLGMLRDRDQFELASQKEAQRILAEISQQNHVNAGLAPLLEQASGKLSRDWRPPLEPDGLVLRRRSSREKRRPGSRSSSSTRTTSRTSATSSSRSPTGERCAPRRTRRAC